MTPQIVSSCSRAVDVTGRTVIAMLRGSVNQIEDNPNALSLAQMLHPKEIHPEIAKRVVPYEYGGDGTGDGGATEELNTDVAFDPYHMYDRIDGADAHGSKGGPAAGAGTNAGAGSEERDVFHGATGYEDTDTPTPTTGTPQGGTTMCALGFAAYVVCCS